MNRRIARRIVASCDGPADRRDVVPAWGIDGADGTAPAPAVGMIDPKPITTAIPSMFPPEPRPPVPTRGTVLVAEDDPEMRALLETALRADGFNVVAVSDGGALLDLLGDALLGTDHIDLIVSDIRMPIMTGLQVLTELYQAAWSPPVILVTAFGDPAVHARARTLGAAAVFDKPFDLEDLTTVARACVRP